jgi:hypothetical protein
MSGGTERLRDLVAKWRTKGPISPNRSRYRSSGSLACADELETVINELETALADSPAPDHYAKFKGALKRATEERGELHGWKFIDEYLEEPCLTDARSAEQTRPITSQDVQSAAPALRELAQKIIDLDCIVEVRGLGVVEQIAELLRETALADSPRAMYRYAGELKPQPYEPESAAPAPSGTCFHVNLIKQVGPMDGGPEKSTRYRCQGCSAFFVIEPYRVEVSTLERTLAEMPPAGQGAHGWNVEQILVYIWQCIAGEGTPEAEYPYERFRNSEMGKRLRVELEALSQQ